jgi:hypothetical protein
MNRKTMKLAHRPLETILVSALLALLAAPVFAQGPITLLAPADGDLAAAELVTPPGQKAAAVPRESVAMSWSIDADRPLDATPEPFIARSLEYSVAVTGRDLGHGVPIHSHGAGAVVRLNPAPGEKGLEPLDPVMLTVTAPSGESFDAGTAMELLASPEQLKAAGAPFVEGTAAFRLRADLGAGTFQLTAGELPADARYLVHVLDRGSDLALELGTDRTDYLHGDVLSVRVALGADALPMERVEGVVTSPAGRAWPIELGADGGVYRGSLRLDAIEAPAPGLWEVHVAARAVADGRTVERAAHTAFNVAVPSARLDGTAAVVKAEGALALRLGVETIAEGRYELRGVLYGTAADGTLRPLATGHSAAWLEAGAGALELSFDHQLIEKSGLRRPFELRDLRLVDQGRLGLLHRQARGLVIGR